MIERNSDLQQVTSMLCGQLAAQAAMIEALVESAANKEALRKFFTANLAEAERLMLATEIASGTDDHYRSGFEMQATLIADRLGRS